MPAGENTKREIMDQPSTWENVIVENEKLLEGFSLDLDDVEEAIFFGAGTSYYLSLSAAVVFQRFTGISAKALPSSEILNFSDAHVSKNQDGEKLAVAFSRSGETTETTKAMQKIRGLEYDTSTIGVTCYPDSKMASLADWIFIEEMAKEKSVVMTKSFTSMLLTSYQLSLSHKKQEHSLVGLPDKCESALREYERKLKEITIDNYSHYVFLGSGPLYGVACESMLKMKEMALENTEAYHGLEYRHGPKSIAGDNSLVVFYLTEGSLDYEKELVREVTELGATSVIIGGGLDSELRKISDIFINLDTDINQYLKGVLFAPFAQQIGVKVALAKGLDPDAPRNLNQVVKL